MTKVNAIRLITSEVRRRSGSRKYRSFGMVDSMIPISNKVKNTLNITKRNPYATLAKAISWGIPHGKKIFTPKTRSPKSIFAEDHSIRASLFPEYSKIIAS